MSVTLTTWVVARADLLSCEVGEDATVLLDADAGVYLGFDGPAALIWSMVKAPVSIQQLCRAIVSEYEVDVDQCERDVRAFVDDLLRRGLVAEVAAPDVVHAT